MPKVKKITKDKRDWLNPLSHSDSGHVHMHSDYSTGGDDNDYAFTCDFAIADCTRKVFLDFSMFCASKKELDRSYKDRKAKLRIIRAHLDEIEKQMDDFYTMAHSSNGRTGS